MKLVIDIPEGLKERIDQGFTNQVIINKLWDATKNSTPLDNLRAEIEKYITHSPYITGYTNCCRLRDDVMRIIDKYKAESEVNTDADGNNKRGGKSKWMKEKNVGSGSGKI